MDAASAVTAATTLAGKAATSADEILKGYLIKALDKTGNLVDKAVDMVSEQAPLLVQEVLHWYFTYNLILFVIGVILLGAVAYGNYKAVKSIDHDSCDFHLAYMFLLLGDGIAAALLFGPGLLNLQWLKIYIAPRLWLIEYTMSLVKPHTH